MFSRFLLLLIYSSVFLSLCTLLSVLHFVLFSNENKTKRKNAERSIVNVIVFANCSFPRFLRALPHYPKKHFTLKILIENSLSIYTTRIKSRDIIAHSTTKFKYIQRQRQRQKQKTKPNKKKMVCLRKDRNRKYNTQITR